MQRNIIRKKQVRKKTGLSDTTIWRHERAGDFSARVQMTEGGAVGPTGPGLITGICKSCSTRADDELLRHGLDYMRQLWPDMREGSPAALHPKCRRA
jgi:Prophage CP4-57 regulatory protein (AlpA)